MKHTLIVNNKKKQQGKKCLLSVSIWLRALDENEVRSHTYHTYRSHSCVFPIFNWFN